MVDYLYFNLIFDYNGKGLILDTFIRFMKDRFGKINWDLWWSWKKLQVLILNDLEVKILKLVIIWKI